MIYFDTSYLLKCYLAEPGHEAVRQLAQEAGPLACVSYGLIECRAGVHRHLREGKLTTTAAAVVFQVMQRDDAVGLVTWFPVTALLLERVKQEFEKLPVTVFLRTADALHLVCAREQGFREIYSNDRHLLAAAPHFGLACTNVIA
jgi:predicted nucleic acid-binding protein